MPFADRYEILDVGFKNSQLKKKKDAVNNWRSCADKRNSGAYGL